MHTLIESREKKEIKALNLPSIYALNIFSLADFFPSLFLKLVIYFLLDFKEHKTSSDNAYFHLLY